MVGFMNVNGNWMSSAFSSFAHFFRFFVTWMISFST